MRISIVSPAPQGSSLGNAVTADRYAELFSDLGFHARVVPAYVDEDRPDVLVALHARKSAESVLAFSRAHPQRRSIVVLTGTDIYRDIERSARAREALAQTHAIVALQPCALDRLDPELRSKAVTIEQSAPTVPHARSVNAALSVCVLGHLRYEKDPLRAAYALERIRADEATVCVHQAGGVLQPYLGEAAQRIARRDARYRYAGELSRTDAQALLASSDVMVISSRMEGGANVVSAAIACGTPILASRIDGNVGLLGADYPGYFPVTDTKALARLLVRCDRDRAFLRELHAWCDRIRSLVEPRRERDLWAELIERMR